MAVQLAAWREAFVPILPEGFRVPEREGLERRMAQALADPGVRITLAEAEGEPRGWVTYGESRDADAGATTGEVRALFVHPGAWRRGLGAALVGRALSELTEMGYREATLWSFAHNQRANAFYEAQGFERDGAEKRQAVFLGALEVRYRRPLG